jgi:hypothetical protein
MAEPFRDVPLKPPNLLHRLLGREAGQNAITEVGNLLSRAARVSDVSVESVQEVAGRYKLVLKRHFRNALRALYCRYLEHCLRDRVLSAEEIRDLAHLKAILGLADRDVQAIHDEVGRAIYGQAVAEILADRRLDPEEKAFLERLEKELRLPREIADRLLVAGARRIFRDHIDATLANQRLSRDEEQELEVLARDLNLTFEVGEQTRALLDKYRLYWLIENGEMPELKVGIPLQEGERCHFETGIDWYERRRVTRRVRFDTPKVGLKIPRSAYWQMGDLGLERSVEDVMIPVGSGPLYLTNQRLVFTGGEKRNIELSAIIDVTAYSNGVEIERERGKAPFLAFDRDVDLFAMMLARTVRDVVA